MNSRLTVGDLRKVMEVLQDDTPIMYWEDLTDCVVSGDPTGYVYAKEVHLSAEGLQIK